MANILERVKSAVMNSQLEVEEVAILLELTVDDLLEAFPQQLEDNAVKFGVFDDEGVESTRDFDDEP
jgi:hypothetical protein